MTGNAKDLYINNRKKQNREEDKECLHRTMPTTETCKEDRNSDGQYMQWMQEEAGVPGALALFLPLTRAI